MWSFPLFRDGYGVAGSLVKTQGAPSAGNGTVVYFSTEDCADTAKRAVANGGSVFREKTAIGEYGFIAAVIDTEGNRIGVHSK